jgi:peptide/nickel transport system substrate-binding protein
MPTVERDISIGEVGDVSIGDLHRALVWEVERKLAEDRVRPIIFYTRLSTCWQPWVKGFTIMVNSLFNGWRMEDVWLDK